MFLDEAIGKSDASTCNYNLSYIFCCGFVYITYSNTLYTPQLPFVDF